MAFGEGHGNMISLVHKNVVILIIFTGGGLSLELKEDSMKSSVGKSITFRCHGCEKRHRVGDEWRRTEKWRQATCNMTGIEGEHNANTEGLSDSLNSL